MGLLLDSTILIDVLLGREVALPWIQAQSRCPISVVTWIEVPDAIILATARCHQLPLARRNTRDFPQELAGLVVPCSL